MIHSKKLFFAIVAFMSFLAPLHVNASYDAVKTLCIGLPILIAGPCTIAISAYKLRLDKQIKKSAFKATKLQKHGRIGLAIGTILSAPYAFMLKSMYEEALTLELLEVVEFQAKKTTEKEEEEDSLELEVKKT